MLLGSVIFILGVLFAVYIYMAGNDPDNYKFPGGIIIAGGFLFFLGVAQITRTKDTLEMDRRKSNRRAYGVEEPEMSWECPQCKTSNPNTAYTCQKCGYKLI